MTLPTAFDAEAGSGRRLHALQARAPDIEAWLLRKDPRAIGTFRELGPDEYARAFTAAQTAGTDIADDLYFALVDVFAQQGTEADFVALVTPTLKAKGWLRGDDGAIATRVKLIYDTNLRLARAAGRWDHYQAGKFAAPYIRAFTVGDERVRHPPKSPASDHRAWDGIILPVDHPFWRVYWPPLGFRCRCAVIQMTRSDLARRRASITSDADLDARIARLGPPVFAAPAAGVAVQAARAVQRTNETLMPGMPPVDPAMTTERGREAWRQVLLALIDDEVAATLAKLFA